jgi:hypothetical protein
MRTYNTDLIVGLVTLAITVTFGLAREPWTPLSAHWPNAILVFMLLCALYLLGRAFLRPQRAALFDEGSRVRMTICVVALLVWALGLEYAGFIVMSIVMFYFFWWYLSRAVMQVEEDASGLRLFDHGRAIVIIVLLVVSFHYVFTRFLYVPLPKGLLI